MKKILFTLLVFVASISMNAQIMEIRKNGQVVKTYTAAEADEVVFKEEPVDNTVGTAKRTGNIDVKWVQLWENGPKFAEYNVGAVNNKAEDYGGHYYWGKSIDNDPKGEYNSDNKDLKGEDDTATKLWGSSWRMPTEDELRDLTRECDYEKDAEINGVRGTVFIGRGDYSKNRVFFPYGGQVYEREFIHRIGEIGKYWSSTPDSIRRRDGSIILLAYFMEIDLRGEVGVRSGHVDDNAFSVRAVLAE